MTFPPLNEQMDAIRRGAVDLISEEELAKKIERARAKSKPLVVKLGADPSTPDLHIGHGVVLRKLRTFQDLGHQATLIIGDFTAMIGDPSGRQKTRPLLSLEEVAKNGQTYVEQVSRILDRDKLKVLYNSEWLNPMTFADVIKLVASYTVSQMLERNDFHERFNAEQPISLHEFLYPLAQGMDSVSIKADIELGGTDQKFNLLVGRELQRHYGSEPQCILTMPLLEGTDGERKMSKSYGNSINFSDSPDDMFGKTMSIPDPLIPSYFAGATGAAEWVLVEIKEQLDDPSINPRNLKVRLGQEIVRGFYGDDAAREALERFTAMFVKKEVPEDIDEIVEYSPKPKSIVDILVENDLLPSKSEARRRIEGNGVSVDGERISDVHYIITPSLTGNIIKAGKRSIVRYLHSDIRLIRASNGGDVLLGIVALIRNREGGFRIEMFILDLMNPPRPRWNDSLIISHYPSSEFNIENAENLLVEKITAFLPIPLQMNKFPAQGLLDIMGDAASRNSLRIISEKTESVMLQEYIQFYDRFGKSQGRWS
jgi:tyrosyl-tRNA synthetase